MNAPSQRHGKIHTASKNVEAGLQSSRKTKKISIKEKTERDVAQVMENARNDLESDISIRKFNIKLLIGSVVMALMTNILAFTESSIKGFISVDQDNRVTEISNMSVHDDVHEEDVIAFASDAVRRCMTFTYLSKSFVINDCLKAYFSRYGFDQFSEELTSALLIPAKDNFFDLKTTPAHSPTIVSNTEFVNGRAAWKLRGPFNMELLFNGRENVTKSKDIVIWVVKEYKSKMPSGLSIHSVAMRDAQP